MTDPPKAPAPKPEPSAFERMKELTRRIVAVSKSELPKPKRKRRNH
jgi:hypothetical protein